MTNEVLPMIIPLIAFYQPPQDTNKPPVPPSYDDEIKKKIKRHKKDCPKPIGPPVVTTMALGEEGGTTEAVGEEGGGVIPPPRPIGPPAVTTMALGEEGGTTEAVGEEGGGVIPPPQPGPPDTNIIDEPFIVFNNLNQVVDEEQKKKKTSFDDIG